MNHVCLRSGDCIRGITVKKEKSTTESPSASWKKFTEPSEFAKKGFFDDIFVNEGNYPFLEKIYDSNNSDKTTKYKIFKINYEELK